MFFMSIEECSRGSKCAQTHAERPGASSMDGRAANYAEYEQYSREDASAETLSATKEGMSFDGDRANSLEVEDIPILSGNPTIEEILGSVRIFRDLKCAQTDGNPIQTCRKEHVCVLAVPSIISCANFCRFLGTYLQHIRQLRILRRQDITRDTSDRDVKKKSGVFEVNIKKNEEKSVQAKPDKKNVEKLDEDVNNQSTDTNQEAPECDDGFISQESYMVLLTFRNTDKASEFYFHYNGMPFSSLSREVCQLFFVEDFEINLSPSFSRYQSISTLTGSLDCGVAHDQTNLTELPNCPVCLERLDQHISGILTTICNHSFHTSCIQRWEDISCPVCRYTQGQEKSICMSCGTTECLWMCLICGNVGCGRYSCGHAIEHWRSTQHCYAVDLDSQKVWDYVGDNYVHRLVQTKSDGNFVEIPGPFQIIGEEFRQGMEEVAHRCRSNSCDECQDEELSKVLVESKMEAIALEYNNLLTRQLESQRQYFEEMMIRTSREKDMEAEAVRLELEAKILSFEREKKERLRKAEDEYSKLRKEIEEKDFYRQLYETLIKNQEDWEKKVNFLEQENSKLKREKDVQIEDLKEQVRDLMFYIDAQKAISGSGSSCEEIKNGKVMSISDPPEKSSTRSRKSKR